MRSRQHIDDDSSHIIANQRRYRTYISMLTCTTLAYVPFASLPVGYCSTTQEYLDRIVHSQYVLMHTPAAHAPQRAESCGALSFSSSSRERLRSLLLEFFQSHVGSDFTSQDLHPCSCQHSSFPHEPSPLASTSNIYIHTSHKRQVALHLMISVNEGKSGARRGCASDGYLRITRLSATRMKRYNMRHENKVYRCCTGET